MTTPIHAWTAFQTSDLPHQPYFVMPGLVPGIHEFRPHGSKTWMAGTSPAMTMRKNEGT
jgi:hypothetical protein